MYKKMLYIIVSMFLLTGCWDKIEIEDTNFIIAMGVDLEEDCYVISYVFPNLQVYTGQAEGNPLYIRTIRDDTMAGAVKQLAAQMSKHIRFEHMEAIVLGTSLLRNPEKMKQAVDYLGRSNEYPRRIPVLAAINAGNVLQPDSSGSEAVGQYIRGIYDNNQSVVQNYKLVLQEFLTKMEQKENLMIPMLYAEEGFYKIEDTILYREKIRGCMTLQEMESISWLKEEAEDMEYTIELDDGHVSLDIEKASCDYTYTMEKGILAVKAEIDTRMQVQEYSISGHTLTEKGFIEELEEKAQMQIHDEVQKIFRKMQRVWKTDPVSFLEPLKFKDRDLYWKLHSQWEVRFPKVAFSVESNVVIEEIGIKR